MEPILITAPTVEPITTIEAKAHLRIDFDNEDGLIAGWITAAREYGEDLTGWAFAEQTRLTVADSFPAKNFLELRQYPLLSVVKFSYKDGTGNQITLSEGTDYLVDMLSAFGRVVLPNAKRWPDAQLYPVNPIQIEFKCGNAARLPEMWKKAMLLHIGLLNLYRDEAIPKEDMEAVKIIYSNKNRLRRW